MFESNYVFTIHVPVAKDMYKGILKKSTRVGKSKTMVLIPLINFTLLFGGTRENYSVFP